MMKDFLQILGISGLLMGVAEMLNAIAPYRPWKYPNPYYMIWAGHGFSPYHARCGAILFAFGLLCMIARSFFRE